MGKIALIALAAGCLSLVIVSAIKTEQSESLLSHWSAYKAEFGKRYASPAEEAKRFETFAKNKLEIDRFNAEESFEAGYTQGLNRFSDMTKEEVHATNGFKSDTLKNYLGAGQQPDYEYLARFMSNRAPLPANVDWRKDDRVTSIKDQKDCGSCWAFAAIGMMEGQEKPQKGISPPVDLSVQQLVDCDEWGNCYGSILPDGMRGVITLGGLVKEKDYPYTAENGHCKLDKSKIFFSAKNYTILPRDNEKFLQTVVASYGPVAVSIDSYWDSFINYKGGIYSYKNCGFAISHCVVVVGYGHDEEQNVDYWIIKNSWGEHWGEQGYMRMIMHKNMCQIAFQPVIATFDKADL